MTRVGFLLSGPAGAWLGGANYFRSLLGAIQAVPNRRIQPVVFVSREHANSWMQHIPGIPMIPTSLVDRWSPSWTLRKSIQSVTSREMLLERLLHRHGVALLSHAKSLGPRSRVRTLGWIQDCQHLQLPEFFSEADCRQRDKSFRSICCECDAVVVSSEDARTTIAVFEPSVRGKVRVLHFVPDMPPAGSLPGLAALEQRYGFQGPYFHVPNQFWKHKNHGAVVKALGHLKRRGQSILVLATGSTSDYRNPHFFEELMAEVRREEVEQLFRSLGVVPYVDMLGLMLHSKALINPSFSEGWSTTVEEAKRLGTRVLLSDLPVHREQAPPRGVYFDPRDSDGLADRMSSILGMQEEQVQPGPVDAFRAFGEAYQSLAMEAVEADSVR